jgi:hypothetical protein
VRALLRGLAAARTGLNRESGELTPRRRFSAGPAVERFNTRACASGRILGIDASGTASQIAHFVRVHPLILASLVALSMVGCVETPAHLVPPGSTRALEQRKADVQCEAWLAEGVDTGDEAPIVLGRHPHRDAHASLLRRTGAMCAFSWRRNECVCRTLTFSNSAPSASYVGETVVFSACAELHRRGKL